jgi:polysaccharide deacetylase family protein (PEP-CTERM system associated)
MSKIVNAFTIDFEDWYQGLVEIHKMDSWHKFESRIEKNCSRVLDILKDHDVKATFFILGYVADKFPHLLKTISNLGHEIGSHGYSHTQVFNLTPDQFENEICRTGEIIYKATGKKPIGYRAPIFSIIEDSYWALDILAKNGYIYDSSIAPTFNYRYGMVKGNRFRHEIATKSDRKITEIPVATARFAGVTLPIGGGAFFRFWPYSVTRWAFNQLNNQGRSGVFYMHPWELDPEQPRIDLPKRLSLTHYYRLADTEKKLHRLLTDFKFSTMVDVFGMDY